MGKVNKDEWVMMNDELGKRFFITHSHADNAFAQRFADDLRRLGLDGFFDIYSIRPGDNIPANINKGLAECDIYVPILSNAALDSPWCEEEITAALTLSNRRDRNGRPRIIPVLIEDCQSRISQQYPTLQTRLYVSFVGRYDEALQELVTRGFGLSLGKKISGRIEELNKFICVPLIESGLANEDLSIYKNPPFGDYKWLGIPFYLQNARISLADTWDSQRKLLNSFEPVSGVQAVHFLINAGDGRKKYIDREIGSINFILEGDVPPYSRCAITLGKNVREWAIGNYVNISEIDRRPESLVDMVDDKESREAWRGESRDGQVAVIDMLKIEMDAAKHSKKLIGIEFTRSILRSTITLDYFISAITIELNTSVKHLQSSNVIEETVNLQLKPVEKDRDLELANEQAKQIKEFDLRLRKSMPGSGGYTQAKSKPDINRVMKEIGRECEKYDLWWNSANQHQSANPIEYYPNDDLWVFDGNETKIVDLWVYRHSTLERQYVIIQTEPMPPFGIYDPPGETSEMAGYFQGRYISASEYDDGFTVIDGESVDISSAKRRWRFLYRKFFIFAPHLSVYIWGRELRQYNDEIKSKVYKGLMETGKITADLLRPLEKLKRDDWMTYLD